MSSRCRPSMTGSLADLKTLGKLIILYSGSHGVVNALENVIEAARLLADESRVHFLLVGQGPEKESLQNAGTAGRSEECHFLCRRWPGRRWRP